MATKTKNVLMNQMSINPKIMLPGAIIQIDLPLEIDPFHYNKNQFTIGNIPIRMIGVSNRTFVGEVLSIPNLEFIQVKYQDKNQTAMETQIYTPSLISTGYKELSYSFCVDQYDNVYFFDIKKNYLSNQLTTLYVADIEFRSIKQIACEKMNINAIITNKEGEIFFTCNQEQNLYKLDINRKLSVVAQGIGFPNGLAIFENKIFIADQTGNLFEYDQQTNQTLFLTSIEESYRGYHMQVDRKKNIYITIPNASGKNEILLYSYDNKMLSFIETFNLLGVCGISHDDIFYWIETSREESSLFRMNEGKKEKVISGGFFRGFFFTQDGTLFINDHHTIFKIEKEWLYAR